MKNAAVRTIQSVFLLFILFAAPVYVNAEPVMLGNRYISEDNNRYVSLNSSTKRLSCRFTASFDMTTSFLWVYSGSKTGSPSYEVGIQTDSNGVPSGFYLNGSTITSFNANTWTQVNITTVSLTKGQIYHIVISSSNATALNYNNLAYSYPNQKLFPKNQEYDGNAQVLEYNGSWQPANFGDGGMPIFVIDESGTTEFGNPYMYPYYYSIHASGTSGITTDDSVAGEEIVWNAPATQMTGVEFYVRKYGTPGEPLKYRIVNFTDSVVMADGILADEADVSTSYKWKRALFTPVTFETGKTYRIYLYADGASSSLNEYEVLTNSCYPRTETVFLSQTFGGTQNNFIIDSNGGASFTVYNDTDLVYSLVQGDEGCVQGTFGKTTKGYSTPWASDGASLNSSKFKMGVTGTVNTINLNVAGMSVNTGIRVALYTNNPSLNGGKGGPENLLAESVPYNAVLGWNTIPVPSVNITPGEYWLAFQAEAGVQIDNNYVIGSGGEAYVTAFTYGTFPAVFNAQHYDDTQWSIYAQYCETAAAATPNAGADWILATGNAQFTGRAGAVLLPHNGKMYLIAGTDAAAKNDVWSSSDGVNWIQETNAAFLTTRAYHTGVVYNGKMWVMAGVTGPYDDDVWSSVNGTSWIQETAAAGFPARASAKALVFDNKMWIIGGRDDTSAFLNDAWYSTNGVDWTAATRNAQFPGRWQHEAVAYNGKMYVIGGNNAATINDVWSSPDGIVWTQETAAAPFEERRGLCALTFDDGTGMKMWVYAGLGGSFLNDVWYSENGSTWTQKTAAANFSGRFAPAACVFNDSMWAISGNTGVYPNDVWYSGPVPQPTVTSCVTSPLSYVINPQGGQEYVSLMQADGNASASCGSIQLVEVAFQRQSGGLYWDFSANTWSLAVPDWEAATGNANWTFNNMPVFNPGETYTIFSRAKDTLGNIEMPGLGNTFSIVNPSPTVTRTSTPDETATPLATPTFTATAGGLYSLIKSIGVDGSVSVIAEDENSIYIGGLFNQVGKNSGCGVVWNTVGNFMETQWPDITGESGSIDTVISDDKGGWYIGGSFSHVAGQLRNNIAHILANGALDPIFNPDTNASVLALDIDQEGNIFVGGVFSTINGQSRSYLAKLNATTGAVDPLFNPGVNEAVRKLKIDNAGNIYVYGEFTTIGGQPRVRMAKLSVYDGAVDPLFLPEPNNYIYDMSLNGGSLYVCGSFTIIGGQAKNYLAKLNLIDGSVDNNFDVMMTSGSVSSITPDGAGNLYVAGYFSSIGGKSLSNVARIDALTGAVDDTFSVNLDGSVTKSVYDPSGFLYMAGGFTLIDSQPIKQVAKVSVLNGSLDSSFNPRVDNYVDCIAINSSGKLFIGGEFSLVDSVVRKNIVKINSSDFSVDNTFAPECNSEVKDLKLDENGYIYIAGNFTEVGGQTRYRIAKLNAANGVVDPIFNPSPNGYVSSIILDGIGNIYAGGSFSVIGGASRSRIAKLNTNDGVADATFIANASDYVDSLDRDSNGFLYASGIFLTINGQPFKYLAKLDGNTGVIIPGFAPNPNNRVYKVKCDNAGSVYTGGAFSTIGGAARYNIAKLNSDDGLANASFDLAADSSFYDFAIDGFGSVYLGGSFYTLAGQERYNLGKVSVLNGTLENQFNPKPGYDVRALQLSAYYPRLYVGGDFYSVGGTSHTHFAIIHLADGFPTETSTITVTMTTTTTITPTMTQTASQTVTATITGTATETTTATVTETATATTTATTTDTISPTVTGTITQTVSQTVTKTVSPTVTQTVTQTVSQTVTGTTTATNTQTATTSVTQTATGTVTGTNTQTPTGTITQTSTPTVTITSSGTNTATQTATGTSTETITQTASPSATQTNTETATATMTLTNSPTNTSTKTATQTATQSSTLTATQTITETTTKTSTPTQTATQTITSTVTPSPTMTITITVTTTNTPSMTQTNTETNTPTDTATDTATDTQTPTPSDTFTDTATFTYTHTFTDTPTETYTSTPTDTFTETNTFTHTYTPTITPTFTNTPTPNIDIALDRNYAEPLKGDSIKISVKASVVGELVEIKVYNISGERVRQFNFNTVITGWNEGYWDCKNDAGKTVGQGLYFIRITRAGTVETRKVFILK